MNPAYSGGTLSQFGEGILRGSGAEGQTVDEGVAQVIEDWAIPATVAHFPRLHAFQPVLSV